MKCFLLQCLSRRLTYIAGHAVMAKSGMAISCTIDERATREAGATVLPEKNGIDVKGWRIICSKKPITADAKIEEIKEELQCLGWPEQYFGSNLLSLEHQASGTRIEFRAEEALKNWLAAGALPVQVKAAGRWKQSHQQDFGTHDVQFLDYDWTFTNDYKGTMTGGSWTPSDATMDRALLTARDPILLFADIPLFESELEDNGVASLSVKNRNIQIRVMPKCWYILLRFWLRVDGVLVRLRTTRLFHKFGDGQVLREITYHEGTFKELRSAGAPPEGPVYRDPETASAALNAVAPVGVAFHGRERLKLCQ